MRESHAERERREAAESDERFATERRQQATGLLLLALAILIGTVVHVGIRNVFLPGWWRLW